MFAKHSGVEHCHWHLDSGCFDVLFTLARAGSPYTLSPTELTARSMVTSAAVAQRLNRLTSAGLVTRNRNHQDGRGTFVTLTPAGQQLVDDALPSHLATEHDLLSALDTQERAQLAALLEKMLALHHPRPRDYQAEPEVD